MSQSRPSYKLQPIISLGSLGQVLGMDAKDLVKLADNSSSLYRLAKPIPKGDGTFRQPFDALTPLKKVHERIRKVLFRNVEFPSYMHGSLAGRSQKSNAQAHVNARIVICEDITRFFPSVKRALVLDVWKYVFGFSPEVAQVLTKLTTKDGQLPEGAITSSYLANLVLWRWEPELHDSLHEEGIVYTRYVDDICLSCKRDLTKEEQTSLIARVYGMLSKAGLRAKRAKHETLTSRSMMRVTKLGVNTKTSLPPSRRKGIRAAVFQLEKSYEAGELSMGDINRVAGEIGYLAQHHPNLALPLRKRVKNLRTLISKEAVNAI